jgi:hypothetical protein
MNLHTTTNQKQSAATEGTTASPGWGGERGRVHRPIVWGGEWNDEKINNKKYVVALDGRQSAKKHTTINQKQSAATEGTTEGRRDEREARGIAI